MLVLFPHQGYTPFILQLKFLEIQPQQFRQGAKFETQKISQALEEKVGCCYAGKASAIQDQKDWNSWVTSLLGRRKLDKWLYRNKKDERVCACSRFQVTPKTSHLHVVKRIFSDYAGANLDRKSTTRGCQFLNRRLISWQCKKQTIMATSTTEAEYVAAAICCRDAYEKQLIQVLKIHTDDNVADLLTNAFDIIIPHLLAKLFNASMADLEFVDQHNMVACLEKIAGNLEFHEIVDFLTSSLIHHALTVSPTIYISYIEQFWNTASSQTVNDEKQIHATIDRKAVVVTKASIRSSLLLNDANGTACLINEAIFQNLALMGLGKNEPVSKQGMKNAKPGPTLDAFDDIDADLAHGMDYMDTEEAVNEGRQSKETEELNVTHDTKILEKGGSNKEPVNAAGNIGVSTAVSTASRPEVSTATPMTPPTTKSVFKDEDIFLADALVMLSDKLLGFRSFYNLLLLVVVSTASEDLIYSMAGSDDENPPPQQPQTPQTQQAPHTLSTIKLPILKKGEYDIWAMKMEHYLSHTDYPIWEVIQKGNGHFEGFSVSNSEGLHKGYDRFQSLLSQLEIHGAGVSTKDANQKFLRSLPASWSQVSLVMRTKPGVDSLSFDDLYNNLRVFESDVKGSTRSSSSAQNVAFVSSKSTNSTNDVEDYSLMPRNQLALTRPRLSASIATRYGTLLESADQKEAKRAKGKMQGTLGIDWIGHAEDEQENFALMAYNNSGSETEVKSCLKESVESYAKLKKLYDEQREQLGDASIEIKAYTLALAKDKSGLGYGDQIHEGILSYENEAFQSVFDSRSSDVEDSHVYDRFVNVEGMHAVPPPMTGNYMPLGPDREVDDSMFTYGPKQFKTSESDTQTSNFNSCESNSSVETPESMPEPVIVEPKVVSQPKVWSDAPIIEEYESDSDDEYAVKPSKE
ncbi:hypothetical protein Tco_0007336 [Tanacetum coccineum]